LDFIFLRIKSEIALIDSKFDSMSSSSFAVTEKFSSIKSIIEMNPIESIIP
jgi:hypothetical protein